MSARHRQADHVTQNVLLSEGHATEFSALPNLGNLLTLWKTLYTTAATRSELSNYGISIKHVTSRLTPNTLQRRSHAAENDSLPPGGICRLAPNVSRDEGHAAGIDALPQWGICRLPQTICAMKATPPELTLYHIVVICRTASRDQRTCATNALPARSHSARNDALPPW